MNPEYEDLRAEIIALWHDQLEFEREREREQHAHPRHSWENAWRDTDGKPVTAP